MATVPSAQRSAEVGLAGLNTAELETLLPGLRLLVLYGSRARGEAHAASDWDFGYLAEADVDVDELYALLSKTVHTDAVDLVNLDQASGVLRYQVAEHGVALFERDPETFTNYVLGVLRFWLDAGPVIRRSQDEQLRSLG